MIPSLSNTKHYTHVAPFLLSQTPVLPCADSRVHLKLVCLRMNFGKTLPGAQRVSEACRTCRVVAGSSFPVGEGVSPSSDAGVTGEEAMSPRHHLSLSAAPSVTFLGVLQLAIRCLARFARTVDRLRRSSPVRSKWVFGCTVQPLSLLRPAD